MNVYDLNANWLRLDEAIEEAAGELTPEIEGLMAELLDESKGSLEQAGFWRKSLLNRVEICKERRRNLAAQIERTESTIDHLDTALAAIIVRLGKPQKFPEFTLSTQKRDKHIFALKPGCEWWEIDPGFVKTTIEPRLNELKLAAKEGNLPEQITHETFSETSLMMRTPSKPKEDAA